MVRRCERKVYWIIHGILGNESDSEEILQETFLKALEHIRDFRGDSQFSTWLIQIGINEARMRRRRYRSNLHDSIDEELEPGFRPLELTDWRPNVEEELAKKELEEMVPKAVRLLPKAYRETFVLRVQGLSNEEAAKILHISIPAVKTRILRARLMLRESLAPQFKMHWQDRLLTRLKRRGRSE